MKTFLALLLSLPLFAAAQDSCGLKRETDRFSHQTKISTGFVSFVADGVPLSISIDATKTDIDFFLWIKSDSKCFDDASTVQINFVGDRLKANFKNTGSMNCEGAFHFTFKNAAVTPSNLQRLTDKKIASIKITGSDKTVTGINFTEEQKDRLLRMASCVVKQAKSLL